MRSSQMSAPLGLLLLAIAVFILWNVRQLLLLIFAAIVLAQGLHLQARAFERLGLRSFWTKPVSLGILLAFLSSFLLLIVPLVVTQSQDLIQVLPQGVSQLEQWLDWLTTQIPLDEEINVGLTEIIESMQPLLMEVLGRPLMFVSVPLATALNLLIVLVLALMFWGNPTAYQRLMIRLFPSFYRSRAAEIWQQSAVALSTWLGWVLVEMAIVAVICGIGLWLLGVPYALAQAVLAGTLTFIPFLGPTISVIPPMLTVLERPLALILVLLLYLTVHVGVMVTGRSRLSLQQAQLLPGIALLIQILFARLFGVTGLILAFPLALVMRVWISGVLVEDVMNQWGGTESTGSEPPNLLEQPPAIAPVEPMPTLPAPEVYPRDAGALSPDETASPE